MRAEVIVGAAALACFVPACASVGAHHEADLEIEHQGEFITFVGNRARLIGDERDVAVGVPDRAQVHVVTLDDEWTYLGGFLSGRDNLTGLLDCSFGARPALIAPLENGDVVFLGDDLRRPHHLRPPVVIANGRPRALACGDLDGDGSDDLVLGYENEISRRTRVERNFEATPGHSEGTEQDGVGSARGVVGVAVTDFDFDGARDVVAVTSERKAVLFARPSTEVPDGGSRRTEHGLSAAPRAVVATGCREGSALALLEGGALARIAPNGVTAVAIDRPVAFVTSTDGTVALVFEDGEVAVYDACLTSGGTIGVAGASAVALATRSENRQRLAVLAQESARVSVFDLAVGWAPTH